MPKATEIKEAVVQLLVEGNDVRNFFEAFIKHHSKKLSLEEIQIQDFGGVSELRDFLEGFVGMTGFHKVRSIGIVRDAEKSAENAFKSVQDALKNAELPAPDCPEKREVKDRLAVEVLILPGGNQTGMLETLLCQTFAGTEIGGCIDKFFQCVEPLLKEPIKEHRKDKAQAFAYLATRPKPPHYSTGVAVKRRYWDLNHEVFDGIREFLKRIAGDRIVRKDCHVAG